jgi:hypothetical protein
MKHLVEAVENGCEWNIDICRFIAIDFQYEKMLKWIDKESKKHN